MSLKNAILYTVIMLSISLNAGCGGETVVTKVTPTEHPGTRPNMGVIFSLPRTVVIAEVPLTRVASSPGVFANWTPFFYPELTSDDFVSEKKSVFKVGMAKFDTRGQTDPDNVYIAHIKAKQFETKTLLLEFNEDGIIARTDASSKDDTIDVITSGIKTAASIVAPLIGGVGAASLPSTVAAASKDLTFMSERMEAIQELLEQTTPETKNTCEQKRAAARQVRERASKAAEKARLSGKDTDKTAAEAAQKAADEALAHAEGFCSEQQFRNQLSVADRALYDSLDDNYKAFLRQNFGYQFLTYIAERPVPAGSTGIQFFLTLSEKQQRFIDNQERSASPCEKWQDASKKCLATRVKLELLRAKAAYDKILELRKKRQDTLFETTGTDVNTSSHLEFRLKELDAQIKSLEQTFFFGSSTETSGVAKFEFTPGKGLEEESQPLFTYSRGGTKPGVCGIEDEDSGIFKAFVPEPLKGVCHAPDFLISTDDVRDTTAFVNRFKTGASRDTVSLDLFNKFRAQTQRLIDSSTDNDKPQVRANLLNALLTDLTSVIEGPSIYETVVQHTKLSDATLKVQTEIIKLEAVRNPTEEQLAELTQLRRRLNRSLLDDTYAKELYRHSAWAPHTVSLVIDPRTPGLASAVAKQKLVEDGKRGFPYRIPALTTARLLDDETEKGRSAVRIAQFGPVQSLPANLGGRRSSYKITYFDSTGQIKVFDMTADALIQKDNIKDVTDAVTTLRDSEAAELERDTKLLELRKKKLDAEKALKAAAKDEPSPSPEP